jgi:phosphate-selective porin O/P
MKKIVLFFTVVLLSIPVFTFAQGCMEAPSDEGVNVVGYLQAQYEYMFQDEDDLNSFTFNRARMGLIGNIPYDFSYYIMFEFSPNIIDAPYLLDGFITYSRLAPWASISLGQFKSPFSLELNTPCQGLHTIKRSMVVNELTAYDRDRGIMFNGKYDDLVKYSFAFTNGTGRGNFENNQNKTFAGRLVISPIDMISLGGGYKFGTSPASIEGADEDEQKRISAEIEFKLENILVQAEYITAEDVGSYLTGGD